MVVPPGNHRGSDLRRTCQCVVRFETRGRPEGRLRKKGRRRRQGDLRNKAHPEPLRSLRRRAGLPDFVSHPATRHGVSGYYQWCDYAPLWSRSPCLAPSAVAAGGSCIMRARYLLRFNCGTIYFTRTGRCPLKGAGFPGAVCFTPDPFPSTVFRRQLCNTATVRITRESG